MGCTQSNAAAAATAVPPSDGTACARACIDASGTEATESAHETRLPASASGATDAWRKETAATPVLEEGTSVNDNPEEGAPNNEPKVDTSSSAVAETEPSLTSAAVPGDDLLETIPSGDDDKEESENDSVNSAHVAAPSRNPKELRHSGSSIILGEEMKNGDDSLQVQIVRIEVPFGKPIEEVYDGVHDGRILGKGILGLVRLVTHKSTGVEYAVKKFDLRKVKTEESRQQLREEIYIMCQLDHPNVVRLEEVYESQNEVYLVQELCMGGELFDRLDEQPDYHYTEAQCARLVKQIVSSVRYIHSKGIVHRDMKLENFLFSGTDQDSELKMIDFGLSKHFKLGEIHHEAVGTPYTVSPEVIRGSYDERCDLWAIGVLTFLLLSGEAPFGGCYGEDLKSVRDAILRGKFEFEPQEVWGNISPQAKDFITSLLQLDPNDRPSASEAQDSAWLREWADKDRGSEDTALNPNVAKALVGFKEYSDVQKLLREVLSFTLLPEQIVDLRHEFEKLDTDGSGEISLAGMKQALLGDKMRDSRSLGPLTEKEVEEVFNSMRVSKTETRVHWHEFIAAALSQCKVDNRNLKLAFERLDCDRKGYITFDDVMSLMGNGQAQSESAMRQVWGDSLAYCGCTHTRISFPDFLLLMNGPALLEHNKGSPFIPSSQFSLDTLEESTDILSDEDRSQHAAPVVPADQGAPLSVAAVSPAVCACGKDLAACGSCGQGWAQQVDAKSAAMIDATTRHITITQRSPRPASAAPSSGRESPVPGGDVPDLNHPTEQGAPLSVAGEQLDAKSATMIDATARHITITQLSPQPASAALSSGRESPVPGRECDVPDLNHPTANPLLLDDEALDEMISAAADRAFQKNQEAGVNAQQPVMLTPPQSPKRGAADYITPIPQLGKATISPVTPEFPEVGRIRRTRSADEGMDGLEQSSLDFTNEPHVQNDVPNSPLDANRKLHKAHRQLRLAVLEASKRFEDQQVLRALNKQKSERGAGLTMRHGLAKEMSLEDIQQLVRKTQRQRQSLIKKTNKRLGRGSRRRTASDLAGMLTSAPPGTMIMDSIPQQRRSYGQVPRRDQPICSRSIDGAAGPIVSDRQTRVASCQPSTPGRCKKSVDPFSELMSTNSFPGPEPVSGSRSLYATMALPPGEKTTKPGASKSIPKRASFPPPLPL